MPAADARRCRLPFVSLLFLLLGLTLAGADAQPSAMNSPGTSTPAAARLRARELNAWLRTLHPVPEPSVDRIIVGDPDTVVRGIAVLWTPTWQALRQALADGCNVVVAHEPTFFSHFDLDGFEEQAGRISANALRAMSATRDAKRQWILDQGLVVIRSHDVVDQMPDGVVDSLVRRLGFKDDDVLVRQYPYRVVHLSPPVRAADLAQRLATAFATIGQPGVAFYGDPDRPVSKLGLGTGYGCVPWDMKALGAEMCVTIDDRIKTWVETEWADDAGYPMIVIHHGTSEEWGVQSLHQKLAAQFPGLPVKLQVQGFRARWIPAASGAPPKLPPTR